MRKTFLIFMLSISLPLCWVSVVKPQNVNDDEKLEASAKVTDDKAAEPGKEGEVNEHLRNEFHVDQARIDSLRAKHMGYGEIRITLALAQHMPGGINDANIQKVLDSRDQGGHKVGWGKVAKEQGLKLGPIISEVKGIHEEERAEKKEEREEMERSQKSERPEKFERSGSERHEEFERPERPERMERR